MDNEGSWPITGKAGNFSAECGGKFLRCGFTQRNKHESAVIQSGELVSGNYCRIKRGGDPAHEGIVKEYLRPAIPQFHVLNTQQ